MKTTFDLPEALLREAEAAAAREGRPLRDLVADALAEKLGANGVVGPDKPWMKHFGSLADLHAENQRIDQIVAEEFEVIDSEAWK